MIDLKHLRDNIDLYKAGFAKKQVKVDVEQLLELDEAHRQKLQEVEAMRNERNAVSKSIPHLADTEKKAKIVEMKTLGNKLATEEDELNKLFVHLKTVLDQAPNLPHESVPTGKDDSENMPIKTVGEKPIFDFEPRDHVELGKMLDVIDLETGAETSGARFYYLKNELVLLEFAIVNWLMHKYVSKGFTPVTVPMLVKEHMMYATGFFPADKNEIYHVNPEEDDLYLVGTSEVPLAGLHMGKAIQADELPKRYIGFSTCFRREAGSYGKDTKGILRVHQFDKMEMFSFCHPEKSWEEHDFLRSIEEEILQELGLPYQVVNICGGDLGAPAAKKYDCEVWIPTQNTYRELTSCSNCTDFQARRGGIKYKDENGTHYLHTLNGTAMASTRTLIAILENNQQADGSVKIPEVLHPFLPGVTEIKPK
ncbi:serine--tRNA ligase [Candidatus Peregrinibacteria bacterium CG_4_10_14_0_2_um_filter_43_11]|nr:MAG: serine--tRNA ligase [Candidatus Peregrinibacteria bacterium CG_4_10_14_0_2_um_filter_43_11]